MKLKAIIVLAMVIISTIYILILARAENSDWALYEMSFKSSTRGDVYPGSRNAVLTVVLRYLGSVDAVNPTACMADVPIGFKIASSMCAPSRTADGEVLYRVRPGDIAYFTFILNVDREVEPGNYQVLLNISYYVVETGLLWDVIPLILNIAEYPPLNLMVKEVYFTPYSYPGSCPVNLVVGFKNNGETSIVSTKLVLQLPRHLADPAEINFTYSARINPSEEVYVITGSTCIDPSADPNTVYTGILRVYALLSTDDGVSYTQEQYYDIQVALEEPPSMKVSVVNYELTTGLNMPGFKNTGMRLLLRSEEQGVLYLSYSMVILENADMSNGSNSAVFVHNTILNYLEASWITYNGINLFENATFIKANITINGSATRNGVEYPVSINLFITIPLMERDLYIKVEKVTWSNVYAYPGSTGNSLVITIVNNETTLSLSDAIVEVVFPENLAYPDKLVAYNVVIYPGSLVEIIFNNIAIPSSARAGFYEVLINIKGALRTDDGSFKYISIYRNAVVAITDIDVLNKVLPIFSLVDIFWGEGTPQYVYPGNARAPLTITLQNSGIVTSSDVLVVIEGTSPNDVVPLNKAYRCAAQVLPGDTCTAVFYFDLSNSISGLKTINIIIRYTLQALGVNTEFIQRKSINVYLPSYPAGGSLRIAHYEWLNNNPVFPRTKGAVLTIMLVNLEPYTAYSLWVSIKPPQCMSVHPGSMSTAYVEGPIATLQTTTVSFTLDLENCSIGYTTIILEVDYYLQTAGGGVRKKTSQVLELFVQDDANGIEYVLSSWATTPAAPPVYGAQCYVVFRNKAFPQVTNPLLKIKLPSGVVESRTNSSEAWILPAMWIPAQQVYLLQGLPNNIAQLISQYIQQQPGVGVVGKGDLIVYVISLNIERTDLTSITVSYEIVFIDHWGQEYNISSSIILNLITAPPLIEVYPISPLVVFRNGTAILDVVLENKYNSPVGNVYLALIPVSGNAVPLNAVKYIGKLEELSKVNVRYDLVYNPVQIMMGSVPLTTSSAVFTATVIYTDITGVYRTLNTSLAVMIAPFIEVTVLSGAMARYLKDSLIVNGVIANTGISTARSVVVYLKYSGYEAMNIIGDIDPASQTPFRIELRVPYIETNCTLTIKYRDEYGAEYTYEEQLEVSFVTDKTETPPVVEQVDYVFRAIVVTIIAILLGAFFYGLYRYVRRTQSGGSQ